jgi:hypothetical protein
MRGGCQLCRDIRNIEPLQSPFLLSAVHSYIGQCLHTGSLFYRYSVYAMPLPYKMYQILALKVFKIFVCVCVCVGGGGTAIVRSCIAWDFS